VQAPGDRSRRGADPIGRPARTGAGPRVARGAPRGPPRRPPQPRTRGPSPGPPSGEDVGRPVVGESVA